MYSTGHFLFSVFLLSSSRCFYFPLFLFFAKIINRLAGVGPDRTDATRTKTLDETGDLTGDSTGTCHVIFCPPLYLFLLLALLLLRCLQYINRRGWAGHNGTDAGGDSSAGQDGGGSTGTCHISFCSLLCLFLLLALLLFHCLQDNNRQCWAEPNGTNTDGTWDGTGEQAGGKRR